MKTLAFILAVFVLFFGCVGEWKAVAVPKEANASSSAATEAGLPDSIGYLYANQEYGYYGENDSYNVSFTLEDANGLVVTAPGTLKVTMVDTQNKTLYSGQTSVSEDGFAKSEGFPFYDNEAYSYRMDFSEINKSQVYYANITVEFKTQDARTFRKSRQVYLSYDLVNYSSGYGYGYDTADTLKPINASASNRDVQVTIVEGGVTGSYYRYYETTIDFRNMGPKKKEITVTDAALVAGGRQYPLYSYYSDEDVGTVYPGAAVSKTLEFTGSDYDIDESALGTNATMYLELQVWNDDGNGETFSIQVPFKP
jgi:hypothetical protein